MRVRYLLLSGLVAAASVVAACGESSPLAGEGTNTQYDLSLAITSPAATYAFKNATDSVAYSWQVVDNGSGLVVPNAALTSSTYSAAGIASTTTCYTISKKLGNPFACIKATKTGATTLTDTFLNMNTGATLTASTALTVP
jgi:hypothetical protein